MDLSLDTQRGRVGALDAVYGCSRLGSLASLKLYRLVFDGRGRRGDGITVRWSVGHGRHPLQAESQLT